MEDYLKDQYNVHEDKKWLTSEEDIVPYFNDDYGIFDCGQGYYEDIKEIIAKIGEKFYKVIITANIDSQKMDRGDRYYFVDSINEVTYTEISKPVDKEKSKVKYILFEADFDETESNVYKLCSVESIQDFFCGDEDALDFLLKNNSYYGEWHQYHLVKLEDYL